MSIVMTGVGTGCYLAKRTTDLWGKVQNGTKVNIIVSFFTIY